MPIEEIENEYGCCPICGMNDGYLNLGEEQWFYCRGRLLVRHPGRRSVGSEKERGKSDVRKS
jgi:hypothetical protein